MFYLYSRLGYLNILCNMTQTLSINTDIIYIIQHTIVVLKFTLQALSLKKTKLIKTIQFFLKNV